MLQTSIILGPPSLIVGVLLAFSYRNIAVMELLTPVMFASLILISAVLNMTEICGEVTEGMRQQQTYLLIMVYNLFSLFMGATWIKGFVVRSIVYLPLMIVLKVNKSLLNDDINFAQEMIMLAMAAAMIEASVYINMKAKAQLFLKVKTTEQQ